MCGPQISQIFGTNSGENPGTQGASNAANAELVKEGKTAFDEAQQEYTAQAPLRQQEINLATLTPDGNGGYQETDAASTRAIGDVATDYSNAKDAAARNTEVATGANPGDPSAIAGANTGSVNLAAAEVGAGNTAARAKLDQVNQLASGVTNRQSPNVAAGQQGLGEAAGNLNQSSMQYSQQQQDKTGLLGWLKKGGSVKGRGLKRAQKAVHRADGGLTDGPTGGSMPEDAPRYGSLRNVPLMKTPDGTVKSTKSGPAEGHITGPGTETSDSVPAMLAHNEYVNPAFVTAVFGVPYQDTQVEIARKANDGDPEAVQYAKALMHTVSAYGLHRAPSRIAGQDPKPRGQGLNAARGGVLTSAKRNSLSASTFGLPGERKYPMPDRSHAANAKARATQQEKRGNLSSSQKATIDAKANRILGAAKGGSADDATFTPSQQQFVDSLKDKPDTSSGPSAWDKVKPVLGEAADDLAAGAGKAWDYAKSHLSSQGAINDIKRNSIFGKGSARGGLKRRSRKRVIHADDGGVDLSTTDISGSGATGGPGSLSGASSSPTAWQQTSRLARDLPMPQPGKGSLGRGIHGTLKNPGQLLGNAAKGYSAYSTLAGSSSGAAAAAAASKRGGVSR